jgi:hypothetical protein
MDFVYFTWFWKMGSVFYMGLEGKKGGMDSKSSFLASFDEIYLKNTYDIYVLIPFKIVNTT